LCEVVGKYAEQAHLENLLKITSKELGKMFDHETGYLSNCFKNYMFYIFDGAPLGSQTCVAELRGFDKKLFFYIKKE